MTKSVEYVVQFQGSEVGEWHDDYDWSTQESTKTAAVRVLRLARKEEPLEVFRLIRRTVTEEIVHDDKPPTRKRDTRKRP